MILDKLTNKDLYTGIHPMFEVAFKFLEDYLKNPVAPGRYDICGDDLYVKIDEGKTREEGYYEVHDHYIDLQVMLDGEEKVLCDWRENLQPAMPYNEQDDALFLKDGKGNIEFTFSKGQFMILYPWDAHKPSMAIDGPAPIKKLVFKVKL